MAANRNQPERCEDAAGVEMKGSEIWDVDGDDGRDAWKVEPIIDYQNGTPPRRARHGCVWCDGPSETSGTCKTCAAIPLGERK